MHAISLVPRATARQVPSAVPASFGELRAQQVPAHKHCTHCTQARTHCTQALHTLHTSTAHTAHTAHKHCTQARKHARARWHCTHSRSDLLSTFRTAPRSNTTCWRHMQRVSITLVGAGAATPTVQAEEARLSAQAKQLVHQVWPLSLVAAASAWWRWCCCWSWRWWWWSW